MLFTTAVFAFVFMPIVVIGFYALGARSHTAAAAWVLMASLVFYGYWMPEFTLLLVVSIAVNFGVGAAIQHAVHGGVPTARRWLIAGIVFDLGLLGYFKYANFFADNLALLLGQDLSLVQIVLPIGISFYTFTQIAYLVDSFQGKVRESRWIHYGLFVTYFPHLIAGPVLHHAQMIPQFADPRVYRFNWPNFAVGSFVFAIGLFKKVVLADGMSPYADAVFDPSGKGEWPGVQEAWLGALAYTFQLYFDFSGYSDMAIGLSWMLNIRLPFNFDSPYRATNISDFWRRWHMSLSTFLRDYLYVPLGGNRRGPVRRYFNLSITMLLGGLWHGASWTFVFWGGLHGLYLMVNHAYKAWVQRLRLEHIANAMPMLALNWAITMVCVVVAWVFFRASSFDAAWRILSSMFGGSMTTEPLLLANAGLSFERGVVWCLALTMLVVLAPNSNLLGQRCMALLKQRSGLSPLLVGAACCVAVLLVVVNESRDSVSAFIYFNF